MRLQALGGRAAAPLTMRLPALPLPEDASISPALRARYRTLHAARLAGARLRYAYAEPYRDFDFGDLDSDQRHRAVGTSGNLRQVAKKRKGVARAETGSNGRHGQGAVLAQNGWNQAPGAPFGAKAQELAGIALAQGRDQIAGPGQRAEGQYESNDETSGHLREARGIICDACRATSPNSP